MVKSIIFLFIALITIADSHQAMALLSDTELAQRHMPILRLSSKGDVGVDLTNNGCDEYDYKPIRVYDIISDSSNLPQLTVTGGTTAEDLTADMFVNLGDETGKYIDLTTMYDGSTTKEEAYCDLPVRDTTIYYQVFYDPYKAYPYAIQYWFFYFFNDWVLDHPGDWETISVFLDADQNPEEVVYSTHYEANRHSWELLNVDAYYRPHVMVSNGGHGSYAYEGDTSYSSLGGNDNHLGDKGSLIVTAAGDLAPLRANSSSWLNFDGGWGNDSSKIYLPPKGPAPKGPRWRHDASDVDVPWVPDQDTFWDKAINQPKDGNCEPRYAANIYQDSGPWEWASAYRTHWNEGDICVTQPRISQVVNTEPLTLQWHEAIDADRTSGDYDYRIIIRTEDGATNVSLASPTDFDPSCVNDICTATINNITLQNSQYHYWFIRKYDKIDAVLSPWSDAGLFYHEEGGGGSPDPDPKEPNDSYLSAFNLGQVIGDYFSNNLTISPGDVDYYKFEIVSTGTINDSVNIQLEIGSGSGDKDLDLAIGKINNSGNFVPADGSWYNSASLTDTRLETVSLEGYAPGVYYAIVFGATGYTLGEDDPDFIGTEASGYVLLIEGPLPKVATPTISPNGGTFTGSTQVTLSCSTTGGIIRYTTDGTTPTVSSKLYLGSPFTVSSSSTIKALGFKNDYTDSPIASASFTINFIPELAVTPNSREVNATSGSTTFEVDNIGDGTMTWTASVISGEDWLSITSGSSGTNSGTITTAFSANTSDSSRSGIIRVTASGASGSPKDVTIIQSSSSDNQCSFAYIPNTTNNTVSVIDTSTNTVIDSIAVEDVSPYIAVNSPGTRVYISNSNNNTVSVIDTSTNTVIDTIAVGDEPAGIAVNPSGTHLYISNSNNDTVSVVYTSTNTVINTINEGFVQPVGRLVNPTDTLLYIIDHSGHKVWVIDISTNTVVDSITVAGNPLSIATDPLGGKLYVTAESLYLSVIDTSTNTVISSIDLGQVSYGVAVHPTGTFVYVATSDLNDDTKNGIVLVIDTSTNTIVDNITVGAGASGLSINPPGTYVYVVNYYSNTVSVIDTSTNTVVDNITVGAGSLVLGDFISSRTCSKPLVDTDGDGIPDAWEILYFGNLTTANQSSDFDKDGYTDFQEFLNQQNNELDPDGNPYDPKLKNAPGGTGFINTLDNFWILMMPVLMNSQQK